MLFKKHSQSNLHSKRNVKMVCCPRGFKILKTHKRETSKWKRCWVAVEKDNCAPLAKQKRTTTSKSFLAQLAGASATVISYLLF